MKQFYGTGVAVITPFNSDLTIDFPSLGKIINNLINNGVNYLVSLGTTGETATLTALEKQKVWEYTIEKVANRVPLIAGIGGNDTLQVTQQIKTFQSLGFDAILSVSPYYNKPTQKGIYEHYKYLSEHSDLPLILYNVPGRTAMSVSAETTCRLAYDFKNIIATKEASGNFDQFNQIMRDKPADFLLISGDDPVTLPMMAMGAAGVISVIANAIPKAFTTMVNLCLKGEFFSALPLHLSLIEFTKFVFAEGNPAGIKAAMEILGLCSELVRLPLVSASSDLKEKIKIELFKIDK